MSQHGTVVFLTPRRAPAERLADTVLSTILAIHGEKHLTVSTVPANPADLIHAIRAFDISAGGHIGPAAQHAALLHGTLADGLRNGGSLVLRQFLGIRVERLTPDGPQWVPEVTVYGAALGAGCIEGLSAADVQYAEETDCVTGAPLPREPGVHYADWPAGDGPWGRAA